MDQALFSATLCRDYSSHILAWQVRKLRYREVSNLPSATHSSRFPVWPRFPFLFPSSTHSQIGIMTDQHDTHSPDFARLVRISLPLHSFCREHLSPPRRLPLSRVPLKAQLRSLLLQEVLPPAWALEVGAPLAWAPLRPSMHPLHSDSGFSRLSTFHLRGTCEARSHALSSCPELFSIVVLVALSRSRSQDLNSG